MKNFSTLVQFLYTFIHRSSVLSSFDLHPFAMRSFVLRSFVPAPFCHALFWRRAYLGTLWPHALLAVNYIFYISYFQVCTFQNSCCSEITLVSTIFLRLFQTKWKKSKGFRLRLMSINTNCFTLQFKLLTNESYQLHLLIISIIKEVLSTSPFMPDGKY